VPAITIRMEKGRPIEKRARACRCCARTRSGRQANRSFLAYLNSLALVACQKSFGPEGHSFRLQIDPLRATVMLLRDGGELLALVHLGRTTLMSQNRGRGASEPPLVEKGRDGPSTIVQREGSDIEFLEQIRPLFFGRGFGPGLPFRDGFCLTVWSWTRPCSLCIKRVSAEGVTCLSGVRAGNIHADSPPASL
jgi:hypothetical protein